MSRGPNRGLGIDWTFSAHEGQINNRGETVIHEIGLRCPCNNEDTYAGSIIRKDVPRRRKTFACSNCDGSGYIYRSPRTIVALITAISEDYSRQESGWAMPGDAVMSPKPNYIVSTGDLITFTWPQPLDEGQVIIRGSAQMSDNTARKTDLNEDEDRLWYHAVDSLWCEDLEGHVYRDKADFMLDGSKVIKWVGNSPRKGLGYTIKYRAYIEWESWAPPSVRRDRDRDLGVRVLLRKRHVAQVWDTSYGDPRDKLPFCDRLRGCG